MILWIMSVSCSMKRNDVIFVELAPFLHALIYLLYKVNSSLNFVCLCFAKYLEEL